MKSLSFLLLLLVSSLVLAAEEYSPVKLTDAMSDMTAAVVAGFQVEAAERKLADLIIKLGKEKPQLDDPQWLELPKLTKELETARKSYEQTSVKAEAAKKVAEEQIRLLNEHLRKQQEQMEKDLKLAREMIPKAYGR